MSSGPQNPGELERLLTEFRLYDRNVDVVSAWQYLFSGSELASETHLFDRFPYVPISGGSTVAPDFTLLRTDGSALIGEIANFPVDEAPVDRLCEQLGRYDGIHGLHGPDGSNVALKHCDVMLLVPFALGTAAIRRVIRDRLADPTHPFKPSSTPVIVQFELSGDKYVFQRIPDPVNGVVRDQGSPDAKRLSRWLEDESIQVGVRRFSEIKAARAFVNDPVPDLYLATFLWAKTFPVVAGRRPPLDLMITPSAIAERLRMEHGKVRAADIRRALRLLSRAGLAEERGREWLVHWRELRPRQGERETAETLARLAVGSSASRSISGRSPSNVASGFEQIRLFDL